MNCCAVLTRNNLRILNYRNYESEILVIVSGDIYGIEHKHAVAAFLNSRNQRQYFGTQHFTSSSGLVSTTIRGLALRICYLQSGPVVGFFNTSIFLSLPLFMSNSSSWPSQRLCRLRRGLPRSCHMLRLRHLQMSMRRSM